MASNRPLPGDITVTGMDQASLVKWMQNTTDLINELKADHATYKTAADQARTAMLYSVWGNPGFVIDTNFDVKNATAVYYTNGGTMKTLAANANFNTGTAKTITGAKWGAAMLTVNSSGAGVVTFAAAAAYDSEALAIAALVAPGATDTVMGYVTILAHASGFTAGTDALQGGTGGNVATTTTYYNHINPNSLILVAGPSSLSNSTDLTLSRS